MKYGIKVLLGALALLAIPAHADTVTVRWDLPTTNTNGTAIPTTGTGSLSTVTIQYGTCVGSAFGTLAGTQTVAATVTSVALTLAPGTHCIRAYVKNTYGSQSATSSVVTTTVVVPPTPEAPTITSP